MGLILTYEAVVMDIKGNENYTIKANVICIHIILNSGVTNV